MEKIKQRADDLQLEPIGRSVGELFGLLVTVPKDSQQIPPETILERIKREKIKRERRIKTERMQTTAMSSAPRKALLSNTKPQKHI